MLELQMNKSIAKSSEETGKLHISVDKEIMDNSDKLVKVFQEEVLGLNKETEAVPRPMLHPQRILFISTLPSKLLELIIDNKHYQLTPTEIRLIANNFQSLINEWIKDN